MKKEKVKFLILLGASILILAIIAVLLINKTYNNINQAEAEKQAQEEQAKQESKEELPEAISLKIDIKQETDEIYKCLLTFTANNENNKIKSIKSPAEEGKEPQIIQVSDENGREKVAIDYEFSKGDLDKIFKVVTIDGNEYKKKTAYKIEYDFNGGISEVTEQYGLVGNSINLGLIPSRNTDVFIGWSDNKESTNIAYSKNSSYMGTKEVETLYALWEDGGGIVGYIARDEVSKSGAYSIERSGITYDFDVLYIDKSNIGIYGNYDNNTNTYTITNNINVGIATESKMAVLKCNGNLNIQSNVTITTSTYSITSSNGVTGEVTKTKGLFIYCSGELVNNGTITQTARGTYDTEGENIYLWSENNRYDTFVVPAIGGSGGASVKTSSTASGRAGANGTNRATRRRRLWCCNIN